MRTSDAHAHRDNFSNDSLMFKVSCTHCVMIKWIAGKKLAGRLDFLKRSLKKKNSSMDQFSNLQVNGQTFFAVFKCGLKHPGKLLLPLSGNSPG